MSAAVSPPFMAPLIALPDREAATIAFAQAFFTASPQERALVLERWGYGAQWPYASAARLGCRKGERFSPEQRIPANMLLNGIENREAARDQLIVCCLYHHSCLHAGMDPRATFARVAAVLPEPAAQRLLGFERRAPDDQRLEEFGLEARRDANGEVEIHFR